MVWGALSASREGPRSQGKVKDQAGRVYALERASRATADITAAVEVGKALL